MIRSRSAQACAPRLLRALLPLALFVTLGLLLSRVQPSWAQPHQNGLRDTVNTPVPSPTNGPTSTGTPTVGPGVNRVLLRQGAGYSGTSDTWLYAYVPSFSQPLVGGLDIKGGEIKSALVRFDLAGAVPPGAQVVAAELLFYVTIPPSTVSHPLDVAAFRVLRPWDLATTSWNYASTGVRWGTAGCNQVGVDRLGTPDDTETFFHHNVYKGFDVTESVRYWLTHPEANYGWLLKGVSASTGAYSLPSSRSQTESWRPVLRIDYEGGATPSVTPTDDATLTPTATPTSGATPTATPTIQGGEITALVYGDVNRNRRRDDGEAGVPGALIELARQQDDASWMVIDEGLTAGDGACLFAGLVAGNYRLQEHDPWGYHSTTNNLMTGYLPGPVSITLTFGDYPAGDVALPFIIR